MRLHIWLLWIVWLSDSCTGTAEPPERIRTSPNVWECTYAFSDTTCREMISAWAEDEGIQFSSALQFKQCSDCQKREVMGAHSTRYLIGYDCYNRDGHDRGYASLDGVVGVYRQAENPGEGWQVVDWSFHRCLLSWRCAQSCAIDFDDAVCVPLNGYYIGRWVPVMGGQCDRDKKVVSESDEANESGINRQRETHWQGVRELPHTYR